MIIQGLTQYHAKYFAYELTKRIPSDSLQKFTSTLLDAQVDLNPHQIEAALFAFRSPLSSGAILADEVGLGKTIEAGLIISQKWAERKRKILIIVPSNLRKQWYQELSDKFFLPSTILESKSFNYFIKQGKLNPFDHSQLVICSYQFARKKETYIQQLMWDLVVIDEAHRLRNVYKPGNKIASSIKQSVRNSPKILLTATPLQNSLLELYGLVSIIDDYVFGDISSFRNRYTRLVEENGNYSELKNRIQPICKRTLRRQVYEYVKYTERIAITQHFIPSEEEHQLYELVSQYLQSEKLYALPASQRQLMTLILRKLLASSTYAIAGTLEALSNKLGKIVEGQNNQESLPDEIQDNYESYDNESDEWQEDEENSLDEKIYSDEEIEEIKTELNHLRNFFRLAQSIEKNSKGEVLLNALEKGFTTAKNKGAKKKAVIFTESRRTQKYLFELLQNSSFANKIVLFNGTNTDELSKKIYTSWLEKHNGTDIISGSKSADVRASIVDYFKDEAEMMIATEAAAEGINLQFCSLVVNYDLPWNPQRIEQRIGRCHRYGQKYDVVVVNFLNTKNAADQRIYKILDEKFKLFSGVFGASDEVLGAIESGVDFEKRIVDIFQRCRTEEEIQSSFDQLQKELETQIDETIKTTRQKLLESFDQEVIEKLRIKDAESKQYLNVYQSWLWQITRFYLKNFAVFDDTNLSFYLNTNPFPELAIHPGPYHLGKQDEQTNLYRIGHPLAKRIIEKCKALDTPITRLRFEYSNQPLIKIAVLEELIGQSGWMKMNLFTICSLECEEHIIFAATTDDGFELNPEQIKRLFTLPSKVMEVNPIPDIAVKQLEEIKNKNLLNLINSQNEKNRTYFMEESDKLNKWADDIINSAELEIKKTKTRIRELNRQLRDSNSQEEIFDLQKELKEIEIIKRKQRQNIFEVEDEIETKRDEIIGQLEQKMKQNTSEL